MSLSLSEIREMCEKATNPERFQDSVDFYDMAREELPRLVGVLESIYLLLPDYCRKDFCVKTNHCYEGDWPNACTVRDVLNAFREAGIRP